MIIMPVPQEAPPPTARSRELGKRIDDVVRDFKRDHPDVTDDELRSALLHSAPTASGSNPTNARRAVAIAVATIAAISAATMVTGGGATRAGSDAWMYVGVAIGVLGLVFVVIQFARRG